MIRTCNELFEQVAYMCQKHPYEVPDANAVDISQVLSSSRGWINQKPATREE